MEMEFKELKEAIEKLELVDAHAHNIVALDSSFPFIGTFSEANGDALTLAPHSLSFKRRRLLTTTAMAIEMAHRFIGSSMALSVGKSRNGVSVIARVGLSSSVSAVHVPRRMFMHLAGFGSVLTLLDFPGLAAPVPEMKEPQVIRTLKLPSGVRFQEIIEGEGPEAHEGDLVELNYVCRRANGYFVHSTVDQFSGESSPVKLILDESDVIEGLKEVLVGMKAGGKRRALIPPSVGYINETLKPIPEEFGPRRSLLSHANESLVFEIQLLKVL